MFDKARSLPKSNKMVFKHSLTFSLALHDKTPLGVFLKEYHEHMNI